MFAEDVFVVIVAQSRNKAIQLHVSYQESPQSASLVTDMFLWLTVVTPEDTNAQIALCLHHLPSVKHQRKNKQYSEHLEVLQSLRSKVLPLVLEQ